ncbi:TVP38/TMEM64 family protein [Bacillus pinisoli]|uniref:TVP38/TMEM64 family protein n=1 Tax=Bacillus pinisoli TaxID=2901866 RepID=UPI001FF40E04|nr:VTT domain-containing protein [Bacillus pinisoli]
MTEFATELMTEYRSISYFISVLLNIFISIFAFIPSFFITAANIYVFGLWEGMVLSLVGEVMGSIISFALYRKGIKLVVGEKLHTLPYLGKLQKSSGLEAFVLILSLRLLPFVPSGLVNIAASFSKVSIGTFGLATLLGKIPAVFIEAYAVSEYMSWEGQEKLYFTLAGLCLLVAYYVWRKFSVKP